MQYDLDSIICSFYFANIDVSNDNKQDLILNIHLKDVDDVLWLVMHMKVNKYHNT